MLKTCQLPFRRHPKKAICADRGGMLHKDTIARLNTVSKIPWLLSLETGMSHNVRIETKTSRVSASEYQKNPFAHPRSHQRRKLVRYLR